MRGSITCLVMAASLTPGVLFAQDADQEATAPTAQSDRNATVKAARLSVEALAQQPAATQARQTQRTRRPSMVGYIEDSTVLTQVRLRFDAGLGNSVPDRAEFFYAKCGCYHFDAPPYGDINAPGPGGGVPTELNFQQLFIQAEYAARDRVSVFAELPFRFIQPQGFLDFGSPYDPFDNSSGLGDIRAGAKFSVMASETGGATVQVRAGFPSGDASKGLGSDLVSFEPALLFNRIVSDRISFEGQVGAWFPFGGSDGVVSDDKFSGNIIYYGIGPSFDLVRTDRVSFAPVVELVGWRIINGFETNCSEDLTCTYEAADNIVNLKIGARTTISGRSSFYFGFGFGLTDAKWYDDILRFEYRVGF